MPRDAQGYSEIHRELSGLLKDSQDTLGYFNLPECAQDLGGVSWQPWTTLAHWVYQVAQEAPGFPKGVKVSLGFEVLLLMDAEKWYQTQLKMIQISEEPLHLYTDSKWQQSIKFGNKKGLYLMKLNDEISEQYLDKTFNLHIQIEA